MRPNTLETDRTLLYRLGRAQPFCQLGTVLATATTTVGMAGFGSDYPQQLTQVSWGYVGSGPVANDVTLELFRGTTSLGVTTITAGTVANSTGGLLTTPIDDYDFANDVLSVLITGNAGNPAGSTVSITALVTAQ